MKLKILFLIFLFAAGSFLTVLPAHAQENQTLTLTADKIKDGGTVRTNNLTWKYRAGDDAAWAARDLDESDWQTATGTAVDTATLTNNGWRGTGWFRLHLTTDESLRERIVGLMMWQTLGASEIYLDGELLRRFGEVKTDAAEKSPVNAFWMPFAARFAEPGEHIIAVRFQSVIEDQSSNLSQWLYSEGNTFFELAFADLDTAVERRQQVQRTTVSYAFSSFGVYLAVGLLHLLLFWFYPPQRGNLYFGVFAIASAVSAITNYLQTANGAVNLTGFIAYGILVWVCFALRTSAFLMFLYTAFLPRLPRFALYLIAFLMVSVAVKAAFPNSPSVNIIFIIFTVGFVAENLRVTLLAVWHRVDGAWIVALGVLATMLGPLQYLYMMTGLTVSNTVSWYLSFVFSFGILAAVSIYLARNFGRTKKDLQAQLFNVKDLSARQIEQERRAAELRLQHEQEKAENQRRAKELEEARQLQFSMLPKKLPDIAGLEIGAYMKPATEVGGDYYDFHVGDDGTLTVAVGDATGHGLKAGTVVTATKSLFNNLAAAPDIPDTLRQISGSLKAMNLRGLFMAMTLIKLKDNRLTICAAGMPSTLVYRAADKTVEEISIRALPLGGMTNFNYRGQEISLRTGDCVIVMSDGFPEMFNPAGEMLGFDKAAEVIKEIAAQTPQDIIDRFVEVSRQWANERPADDDVTFVVLKIK